MLLTPTAMYGRRRGLETLALLAAWKLAAPQATFLLRGNHESATCTLMYGFKGELVAKYGKSHWRVRAVLRPLLRVPLLLLPGRPMY